MKRLAIAVPLLALVAWVGTAQAQQKADTTGRWTWSVSFGGQTREQTLKLKLEGDKLTGSLIGRNNEETKIEDATFKDGEIAFKVTREFGGRKSVTKYTGKLSGDTIKGKTESDRGGQTQARD